MRLNPAVHAAPTSGVAIAPWCVKMKISLIEDLSKGKRFRSRRLENDKALTEGVPIYTFYIYATFRGSVRQGLEEITTPNAAFGDNQKDTTHEQR